MVFSREVLICAFLCVFNIANGFSLRTSFVPAVRGGQVSLQRGPARSIVSLPQRKSGFLPYLSCQLEPVTGGDTSDSASGISLNEEALLLIALKQLKKNELPAGSKVLVCGELS